MRHPFPWHTNNAALALCLERAGCKPFAVWNVYTPALLKKLRCNTVAEAHGKGLPGQVYFFFEKTPQLLRLCAVFDDQRAKLKAKEPVGIQSTDEEIVRIAATTLDAWGLFRDMWKTAVPKLGVPNPGEVQNIGDGEGGRTVKHPGMRFIPANATEEVRSHLGISK